ncbi:MAG: glucosylceramidase [Lachnospiraceae bacterium]|nr:glucosylceramidase [Lachnospiraceae bacterium]
MKLKLYTTDYKWKQAEHTQQEFVFAADKEKENELLNLHPEIEYQRFDGFGGALTDAVGYVYAQMDEANQEKILHTYFGKEGIGYNRIRIPIDSCDFSLEQFQAVSDKDDLEFKNFSLARWKKYIFPLWKDIQKMTKDIEIMVSPWSPPDFMKTNGKRVRGGSLKEEYRAAYADYLCRYIKELEKIGMPVKRMSIQNEPKAVQTWDSCVMDAEEEKLFLRDYLYPALQKNGLADIEIFIWDHNKERLYERACAIVDETTAHMIKGIAFHWYSGDHFEELRMVREKFPDLQLILSEACIEYSKYSAGEELNNVKKYAHEIIGSFNAGMNAFYDFNLLLDENGGPNHVENYCDAPFMYHAEAGKLEERMTLSAIAHFSKYMKAGAVRIGHSCYTEEIEVTSFKNPDGSIVVVMLNQTQKDLPVTIRIKDECVSVVIKSLSISTGIIV